MPAIKSAVMDVEQALELQSSHIVKYINYGRSMAFETEFGRFVGIGKNSL